MDRQVRRKLAMAGSVLTFSRKYPSEDASYTLVLDRLDGTIVRMENLAKQQEGGYVSKHSSSVRRADLRSRLQRGLLRHLVTVAEDVGSESPAVGEKFRIPRFNATHAAFRAAASEMLDQARANQELLVKHGLSAPMLDQLDAAIKEFDGSLQETDDGRQSHVSARAELKALSEEISRLVRMLDGFNRYRFHHDPELITAWESAKHVVRGPQAKEAEATAPGTPNPVPSGLEPAA
jgi:hypothetical protein